MGKGERWMMQITDKLDLPGEPIPGQPVVELAGEGRVLVEYHQGITDYSRKSIQVRVRYGHVRIHGDSLEVCRMTRSQLVITGRIDGIVLERR